MALPELRLRVRCLHVYRGVLADSIGAAWVETIESLASDEPRRAVEAYAELFSRLAEEAVGYPEAFAGDAWQNHLLDRLLVDDNPLSRRAQLNADASPDEALLAAARHDLRVLRGAFGWSGDPIAAELSARSMNGGESLGVVSWADLRPTALGRSQAGDGTALKRLLATSADWPERLDDLVEHYAAVGSGAFARFHAFRWVREGGRAELRGIAHPDPITLEELVGYDAERSLLLQNTRHFVAGYPANNVLVYGDRGTGKSSTIKALLNAAEFGGAGRLRLVEVPKHQLADFPEILARLRGRPEKFILFVDDLSFDEHETEYKALKAILEGGLEARPDNVLLYATSNRRHLVQERFADRSAPGEELRGQDTVQEKLSLSDRFGITITFLAPDQERFLEIVMALAARRGLALPPDELRKRALQWAAWHNGRSGRCARQFVDHVTGELRAVR